VNEIAEHNQSIIPAENILKEFDKLSFPFFSQRISNENNNKTLPSIRAALLPEALFGELRICDAEKSLEAAV